MPSNLDDKGYENGQLFIYGYLVPTDRHKQERPVSVRLRCCSMSSEAPLVASWLESWCSDQLVYPITQGGPITKIAP